MNVHNQWHENTDPKGLLKIIWHLATCYSMNSISLWLLPCDYLPHSEDGASTTLLIYANNPLIKPFQETEQGYVPIASNCVTD